MDNSHSHDHLSSHADHGHTTHVHDVESEHGHGGIGKYVAVFVALLVLTAMSFAAGSSPRIMSTPAVGWTIMLAISCCKALLVMLFFMHLIWEANWKYVLTIPASIMSVFLLLMLIPDVMSRTRHYSEERWLRAAVPRAAGHPEATASTPQGPGAAEHGEKSEKH
jgi:cytochrome c oxidase subunit 4